MTDMSKRERLAMKGEKVTFTIPRWVLAAIDDLAEDIEASRSDVVSGLLSHCFQDDEIIDEVFPFEDQESGKSP